MWSDFGKAQNCARKLLTGFGLCYANAMEKPKSANPPGHNFIIS
jgi:hypothetical protein